MRHVGRNSILVTIMLVVLGLTIYPPEENLRLGKDLAGGVSLVYTIDVSPDDPPDAVDRTIEVLKKRVNPRGLFEISFVQQGRDRIEITMPLPSDAVKASRAEFDDALTAFDEYVIDADGLERALRIRGTDRRIAIEDLMTGLALRKVMTALIAFGTEADITRSRYNQAIDPDAEEGSKGIVYTPEQIQTLEDDAAQAEITLENEKLALLSMVVTTEQLRASLDLAEQGLRVTDTSAEEGYLELPSPRATALESIKERVTLINGAGEAVDLVVERWQAYSDLRRGLDDPADLIRLLQGAGVLSFRISVDAQSDLVDVNQMRRDLRERGPAGIQASGMGWFAINSLEHWYDKIDEFQAMSADPVGFFGARGYIVEERDGVFYMLLKDEAGFRLSKAEPDWALEAAYKTTDNIGRAAIGFRMDPRGSALMGNLTGDNQGRFMAVLLDDEVYTAPTLQSRISNSGIITGSFGPIEIQYLVNTLAAGSLQAKLGDLPISQSSLAPSMGKDNLDRGLGAALIALIVVAAFMMLYYFTSGLVAIVALACNAIIILGIMSLARASFTLPGIAGIVLTFGTAVDANVLIYERIREELLGGADLRTAVRVAFNKVSSTIVDANVTNLIICFVLGFYGTQEIKGFGITLGIGVIGTMFCSLVITRLILTVLVDVAHVNIIRHQLPIVFPFIDRLLTPRINWMSYRRVFVALSLVMVSAALILIITRSDKMLDTVFVGGTEVDMQFKVTSNPDGTLTRSTLTRSEVQDRVREMAEGASEDDAVLMALRDAEVVAVNPQEDGVTSDRFKVRTRIDPSQERQFHDALVAAFGPEENGGMGVLEAQPALNFRGSTIAQVGATGAPVYPIIGPELGRNIQRDEVANDVSRFIGGVAIVLEFDSQHPQRKEILEARLSIKRNDPSFSGTALRRTHELIVIDGSDNAITTAVILVSDANFEYFADQENWRAQLAQNEWDLALAALTESSSLASVNSFSPAVAASFRSNALFAIVLSFTLILIYVWVRFGSVRYSIAAIIPLMHDVVIAMGMIALAGVLYEAFPGVAAYGIRPFKIDMGLVAAILAIIGYSLNDTIVILDRIRENRGKLVHASKEVINTSINQTFSRTIITTGTTLMSLFMLFFMGGEGVASFSYALICGMIVGTYSSIGVAAPIVFNPNVPPAGRLGHTPDAAVGNGSDGGRLLPSS